MNCPSCKAKMMKGKTNLPYEFGDEQLVVIKDVPALVCGQCGEVFVEITALRITEELLAKAERDGVILGFIKYREAA